MLEDPIATLRAITNVAHPLYMRLAINRLLDYIEEDATISATYNPDTEELEFDDEQMQSSLGMFDILDILTQGFLTGEVDLGLTQSTGDDTVDRTASLPPTAEEIERLVRGFQEELKIDNDEKEN